MTREELIEQARRVARERGSRALSKRDFTRVTGITDRTIYRLFPDGGWREILELAALEPNRMDPHPKGLTREDIIRDARRVADEIGATVLSRKIFASRTGISTGQIYKLFPDGGWREALKVAGLAMHPKDMVGRPQHTANDVVRAAKEAATKHGSTPLSKKQFTKWTGIGHRTIDNLFPDGGWRKVQELAGLVRHPQDADRRSDEEILEEIHGVVTALGHFPTRYVFDSRAAFSSRTLRRRFGGMHGAEERYKAWLEQQGLDSPPLAPSPGVVDSKSSSFPSRLPSGPAPHDPHLQRPVTKVFEYGDTTNFRGLLNAPLNEQGVILLFGMVCSELGFEVEAIPARFWRPSRSGSITNWRELGSLPNPESQRVHGCIAVP